VWPLAAGKAMKTTKSMVSMRVRESGESNSAELTFAAVGDESNSLRLTIANCDWQISIYKALMHISGSGKHSESVTHIAGMIRQKEKTADAKIAIDCGANPPLLTICLPTGKRSFDTRRFEITHDLQQELISLLSTLTYVEPVRLERSAEGCVTSNA
jgi:hypothetical protein